MEAKHPFVAEISNTYLQMASILSSAEKQKILQALYLAKH